MNKQIGIFILAVALAAVAGVLVMNKNNSSALPEKGVLLEGLKADVTKLDHIQIDKAQGLNFSAQLVDGQWLVAELNNYPVDQDKLSKLLKSLVAAQRVQAKTTKPEYFDRLGLRDISDQDSLATQVTLSAGTKSWSLLVGSSPERGHGQYVRLSGKNQSWLIDQNLELPMTDTDWLKQPILPNELQQIKQVQRVGKQGWTIEKSDPEQTNYTLVALPEGRLLKYPGVLNSVVTAISQLNFEQIQPNDEELWNSYTPTLQLIVGSEAGQSYTLELAELDDAHYVRFSSQQPGQYWQNRIYTISSFSAQQLNKSLDDFLQDEKSELPVSETVTDEGEAPQ
ncbi:DUF4340 domain-containing protein [Neptunicella sp. SCSIO 80796]|uniref:DUF4340 domain-containing protein n=1 Tax=Neptunicella plasticusilytica TaxID=3117012 RepID=UPI003A4DFA87